MPPTDCRRAFAPPTHALLVPSPTCNRISIYKGDVVLRNLRLRPDALASLDLPVTVRAGLLGSLTLKARGVRRRWAAVFTPGCAAGRRVRLRAACCLLTLSLVRPSSLL